MILALLLFFAAPRPAPPPRVDFAKDVRPILDHRCTPCHFAGGKMYAKLPFDRPETLVRLGTARLFTRLKDEKERAILRKFLEQLR